MTCCKEIGKGINMLLPRSGDGVILVRWAEAETEAKAEAEAKAKAKAEAG